MRRTKLRELSSWKVRRLAQLSLSEWVGIVQHAPSVCFRRILERLKTCLWDKRRSSHATNQTEKLKIFMMKYILASFRRKFIYGWLKLLFGLIQLIGSTRPMFDAWPSLRSCPLPISPLCLSREESVIFFPLVPKKQRSQKKKREKKKNNAWSQVTPDPTNDLKLRSCVTKFSQIRKLQNAR